MKKRIATFLSLLLVFLIFLSGCQNGKSKQDKAEASTSDISAKLAYSDIVTPVGTFPIVKEPVTFKFFAPQTPNMPDITTNEFTTMYEKKTNVHIEWELVPNNAIDEKKAISLASGQYPDVYLGSQLSREEIMIYGTKGIFIALNDYIELYNPELKKLMSQDSTILPTSKAPDGKIYTYPYPNDVKHNTVQNRMWFNYAFLKNLNMPVPKTTDELYNTLVAFKTKDPNQNGKADEIPMVIPSIFGNNSMAFLMCSFVYFNGKDSMIVSDDDKVSVSFNQPGWKEGLKYLNKLYNEKLLDVTSFTLTNEQVKQFVEKKEAMIVGAAPAQSPAQILNMNGERKMNYDTLPPLKGPQGVQYAGYFPYQTVVGHMAITKSCKNPEILARWVDWLYTWEGALTAREGPKDKEWRVPPQGTLSYSGKPATWERMTTYGVASNSKWSIAFPHNQLIHPEMAANPNEEYPLEVRLYKSALSYEPYRPKKVLPPLYMSEDVIKEYAKLKTDIEKFVKDYAVRFITGNADIDKEWDSYIAQFGKMGLARYIQITQESYNEFLKVNGQPVYKK